MFEIRLWLLDKGYCSWMIGILTNTWELCKFGLQTWANKCLRWETIDKRALTSNKSCVLACFRNCWVRNNQTRYITARIKLFYQTSAMTSSQHLQPSFMSQNHSLHKQGNSGPEQHQPPLTPPFGHTTAPFSHTEAPPHDLPTKSP